MADAGIHQVDSATRLTAEHRGDVVICGSHGGVYPAFLAAEAGVRAVILNDAGVGLERAGLGCLDYCERLGMAAATAAHDSARIGDGRDMAARGRISHVNRIAAGLGCVRGQSVADAAARLLDAALEAWRPPAYQEARTVLDHPGERRVVCLDSASLIGAEDSGEIVLTGSHGGLLGGDPAAALKADPMMAFFNDAGIGIDDAGVGRLAALDQRGVIAVTVDCMTARIGDGLSTYRQGVVSRVNERARAHALSPGMTARDAVDRMQSTQGAR